MQQASRVQTVVRRAFVSAALAALIAAPPSLAAAQAPAAPTAAPQQKAAAPAQNAQAAAMQEFQQRLQKYLELREALSNKLKSLSPTDGAELTARQEALAAAMQTARKGAKQGDLIPAPVAVQIAETVVADYKRRQPTAKRAVLEEVPAAPRPVINKTYPVQAALPTVPPLLLNSLPKLPDNLQYRFFGRHVVILDGDLQIITDYILNVLPPH
jgi:hypothetical protein